MGLTKSTILLGLQHEEFNGKFAYDSDITYTQKGIDIQRIGLAFALPLHT